MASNKSVVVLTPNGRRQTVKVTPNTTILQILEEVCRKQGFKANEFDLKHHNKVLDTTAIIRFTGLPNNAQLEMCSAQKTRTESSVTLGVHLENGNRITGNFNPADSLWDVVEKLCPEEEKADKNLVIIYMRIEVYGIEALKTTNLRSLGLTGGRAMLRLIHKTPEELKTQANVSSVLPGKPIVEKPYIRKPKLDESNKDTLQNEHKTKQVSKCQPQETSNYVVDSLKKQKDKVNKPAHSMNQEETMEIDEHQTDYSSTVNKTTGRLKPKCDSRTIDDFVFLGERNAMAFSMEMSVSIPHEDLPDEFFELTIQDARKLFHDLKTKREELEERPLHTSQLRGLEQSKKVLRQINQYKKSVIRIQFPDRTVLQGTFKPLETIEHVEHFVKEYLHDPSLLFYLYTSPPKTLLDPSKTLVDSECVPTAVLYFGGNNLPEQHRFLRGDLPSKFVTPSTASIAASKLIVINKREVVDDKRTSSEERNDVNVGASTSKAPPVAPRDEPKNKVPKWFKSNN